jgi:hypothetical protein
MTLSEKVEKARTIFEDAAAQGRMNPSVESAFDEKLMELESKVSPMRATSENWWRWGVGVGLAAVLAKILTD